MEQFKVQSNDYLKFLFIHMVIVFTIVFSLVSAINKIDNSEVRNKFRVLEDLCRTTHHLPESDDYILDKMYLMEIRESIKADSGFSQHKLTIADSSIKKIIVEIENLSDKAFELKVSFLGDILVDLRYWIFVMPLFLIFSAIYIFILDYKIVLLKKVNGNNISVNEKYPFNLLRNLFLILQIILVSGYIWVLFRFLDFETGLFKSSVRWYYLIFIYYAFLYCLYIKNKLEKDTFKEKYIPGLLHRFTLYVKKKGSDFLNYSLRKLHRAFFLGITQILLCSTLFLSMSYKTCGDSETKSEPFPDTTGIEVQTIKYPLPDSFNKVTDTATADNDSTLSATHILAPTNKIPAEDSLDQVYTDEGIMRNNSDMVKGYMLILGSKDWVGEEGQAWGSRLMKYAYTIIISIMLLLAGYYWSKKSKRKKNTGFSLRRVLFFTSTFLAIHYFVYFGNYRNVYFEVSNIVATTLIYFHWYFIGVRPIIEKSRETKWVEATALLGVYLMPFIISGFFTCLVVFTKLNGWIFLYFGLIFLSISVTVIQSKSLTDS